MQFKQPEMIQHSNVGLQVSSVPAQNRVSSGKVQPETEIDDEVIEIPKNVEPVILIKGRTGRVKTTLNPGPGY